MDFLIAQSTAVDMRSVMMRFLRAYFVVRRVAIARIAVSGTIYNYSIENIGIR